MAKPCLYTVLTTIVAFSSLVVSNIRPVIDFGWMMTIGIIVAFTVSFTVMPAGMMILSKDKTTAKKDRSGAVTALFASFTERRGSLVLLLAIVLTLLSGYGISRLQVENRFIDYFKSDTEIYRGMEVIDTSLGGTPGYYSAGSFCNPICGLIVKTLMTMSMASMKNMILMMSLMTMVKLVSMAILKLSLMQKF